MLKGVASMDRFKTSLPYLILLIGIVILGVFLFQLQGENQRLKKNVQFSQAELDKANQVALFFIKSTSREFKLVPMLVPIKGAGERHIQAIEALLAGPSRDDLQPVFPQGTKVLGFELKNGRAEVNLNREATRLNVGSSGEALAVAALVNTLTKFPDVYRVRILIEGEVVESLAGHIDLTGEFSYNDHVVLVQ